MRPALAVLFCCIIVSGCGFHLRSYNFSSEVSSYALVGLTEARVAGPLRQALKQAGVREVGPTEATLVMELLDQRRDRRSVSTGGQVRAAEYETSYGVQYRIANGAGEELSPASWIERERVYRIDRDNIVGSSEEQAILERELINDVVGQLVRAMDAVSRNADLNSGNSALENSAEAKASATNLLDAN